MAVVIKKEEKYVIKTEEEDVEMVISLKQLDIKPEKSYEQKVAHASSISQPMATKKLAKRLYKLMKKASKQKLYLRSGLKMVQAKIKKGEKGIAVFAGNASPIEVICHLPVVCEDLKIPYVYVPTGRDLGSAIGVKRCTLVVLIRSHPDYKDLYDDLEEEVRAIPPPISVDKPIR